MVGFGRVRRQRHGREERAEEEPGAELAADEIGVLALPAEPGRLGQRLLHHRRGVDEDLERLAGRPVQPAPQRLQPLLENVVIVVPLRVDGDRAVRALTEDRARVGVRSVVDAQHDHGPHAVPERARVGPLVVARLHPSHVAVPAGLQEGAQPLRRRHDRVRRRHPHRVEAEPARLGDQVSLECGRFGGYGPCATLQGGAP